MKQVNFVFALFMDTWLSDLLWLHFYIEKVTFVLYKQRVINIYDMWTKLTDFFDTQLTLRITTVKNWWSWE